MDLQECKDIQSELLRTAPHLQTNVVEQDMGSSRLYLTGIHYQVDVWNGRYMMHVRSLFDWERMQDYRNLFVSRQETAA